MGLFMALGLLWVGQGWEGVFVYMRVCLCIYTLLLSMFICMLGP